MFIVNIYTLQTVYPLHFPHHVILNGTNAFNLQNIVWINRTFCQLISGFQHRTVKNFNSCAVRNHIRFGFTNAVIGHDNLTFFFGFFYFRTTANLCDDGKTLRFTCFKKLLDTRKTLCDVITGYSTGMERTHGQLCTRFTDGLCGNNTNCFADLYSLTGRQVGAITFCTCTIVGFTGKHRSDFYFCISGADYCCSTFWRDHTVGRNDYVAFGIGIFLCGITSGNSFFQCFDGLFSIHNGFHIHARNGVHSFTAILFTDDQLLRYVYKTSGQVTGVGCTKRGIRQTFTCTMGGNEVLQYVKTFTEIGLDRKFDGTSRCIGHQTTHTGKLFNLLVGTTGSGIGHHEDVIVFIQTVDQFIGQFIIGSKPGLYNGFIPFFFRHETTAILFGDVFHLFLCIGKNLWFFFWHGHIGNGYAESADGRVFISQRFDIIKNLCGFGCTMYADTTVKNLFQLFFATLEVDFQFQEVFRIGTVYKTKVLHDDFIKQNPSHGTVYNTASHGSIRSASSTFYFDFGMKGNHSVFIGKKCFIFGFKAFSFSFFPFFFHGQIIYTKDHILRRNGHRRSIRRFQKVVRRQQKETTFCLCFYR